MTTSTLTRRPSAQPTWVVRPPSVLVTVLALLTLVGAVAGIGRLLLGLGPTTALSDGYPWGIWIGFDFVLIAFSGAGFTMAAVAHVLHMHKYHAAARPAILAGLMGYTGVLLLLVLDLGRPDRFYHFILFWNVHSPLFEISWCVLLYTTILLIETSPFLMERLSNPWLRLPLRVISRLMLPVSIIGVTLSSLHQSTLGTLYLNMPHRIHALWYTPIMPLLFFVSSIMAGLSLASIVYRLACRIRGEVAQTQVWEGLFRGAGLLTAFYLTLKIGEIILAGELPQLLAFDAMSRLMWLEVGVGGLLPMAIALTPTLRRTAWGAWGGPLLILFGVLMNRFSATLFAQTSPIAGAVYVPHILEWLTTAGVLAGVALAWMAGVRFLSIFERHGQHDAAH